MTRNILGRFYANFTERQVQSQQTYNVETTSIQRLDVESTLNRRCFTVVCLLGYFSAHQAHSVKGSTRLGKNFVPCGSKFLAFRIHSFAEGRKTRFHFKFVSISDGKQNNLDNLFQSNYALNTYNFDQ